jgi:hypothetical protein
MDVNDNACFLNKCVALEPIASKLAPTGDIASQGKNNHMEVFLTLKPMVFFTSRPDTPNKQGPAGMARVLLKHEHPKIPRLPGVVMKKVIQPVAWFVVLTSIVALASSVSLGLV